MPMWTSQRPWVAGTAAEWTAFDAAGDILGLDVLGWDKTNGIGKLGDGATSWAGLSTLLTSAGGSYQPLDSDLTAIAALTTTSFGRGLLILANAAALLSATGVSATAAELNFMAGVTSAVQTQLNGKQPLDADLTAIAALTTTSFGRAFLTLADAAASLTYIGAQPVDSDLTAIAAITTTAYGRLFLALSDAAGGRTHIDAQQADADLAAIAALTTTAFGRGLLALANAAALLSAAGVTATAAEINGFDGRLDTIELGRARAYRDATTVTRTNLATADLTYIDLPLDSLLAGDILDFQFQGTVTNNTGAARTFVFGINLGGVNVRLTAISLNPGANPRDWILSGQAAVVNASSDVDVTLEARVNSATVDTVFAHAICQDVGLAMDVDTTPTLTMIGTMSAADFTVSCTSGSARLVRA